MTFLSSNMFSHQSHKTKSVFSNMIFLSLITFSHQSHKISIFKHDFSFSKHVFSFLSKLRLLWMKLVNLIGEIPKSLRNLSSLEHLDLAGNDMEGKIPHQSLVLPNMSFNDISGSIPSNDVFRLMGSSAYEGNPKLRGAPLNHILLPL
ncbi:hypothetical protein Peur_037846 [Populus x canadensis]